MHGRNLPNLLTPLLVLPANQIISYCLRLGKKFRAVLRIKKPKIAHRDVALIKLYLAKFFYSHSTFGSQRSICFRAPGPPTPTTTWPWSERCERSPPRPTSPLSSSIRSSPTLTWSVAHWSLLQWNLDLGTKPLEHSKWSVSHPTTSQLSRLSCWSTETQMNS